MLRNLGIILIGVLSISLGSQECVSHAGEVTQFCPLNKTVIDNRFGDWAQNDPRLSYMIPQRQRDGEDAPVGNLCGPTAGANALCKLLQRRDISLLHEMVSASLTAEPRLKTYGINPDKFIKSLNQVLKSHPEWAASAVRPRDFSQAFSKVRADENFALLLEIDTFSWSRKQRVFAHYNTVVGFDPKDPSVVIIRDPLNGLTQVKLTPLGNKWLVSFPKEFEGNIYRNHSYYSLINSVIQIQKKSSR